MRVTIIPNDKWIRKDDTSAHLDVWNFDDSNIHAIQWYDTQGEIEYEAIGDSSQRNESIIDDSILQQYLAALDEYLSKQQLNSSNSLKDPNQKLSNIINNSNVGIAST
jgi:hypothetical protein